jgi:hypothetical protein
MTNSTLNIAREIRMQLDERDANNATAEWLDDELNGTGGKDFPDNATEYANSMTPEHRRKWITRHIDSAYNRRESLAVQTTECPKPQNRTLHNRISRLMWGE